MPHFQNKDQRLNPPLCQFCQGPQTKVAVSLRLERKETPTPSCEECVGIEDVIDSFEVVLSCDSYVGPRSTTFRNAEICPSRCQKRLPSKFHTHGFILATKYSNFWRRHETLATATHPQVPGSIPTIQRAPERPFRPQAGSQGRRRSGAAPARDRVPRGGGTGWGRPTYRCRRRGPVAPKPPP